MCLILLLVLLARRDRLASCYMIQALTCFGLAAAALSGDRPMLVGSLHIALASTYVTIAASHTRFFWARLRPRGQRGSTEEAADSD